MPLVVATSRLYRGMHHLSDVVVGLVIGIISLWVMYLVVRNGPATRRYSGISPARRNDALRRTCDEEFELNVVRVTSRGW